MKKIVFVLFVLFIFNTSVLAGGLTKSHEKNASQWHKGKIAEIERISLNPAQSISLYSNKKTYFIYPPAGVNKTLDKTLYLTAIYKNILLSDRITIKHSRHGNGPHRVVTNLQLFKEIEPE